MNTNPNPATTRARAVLGAALLSGGLALAALASATAHASPFDAGPLPQPSSPPWSSHDGGPKTAVPVEPLPQPCNAGCGQNMFGDGPLVAAF